MSETSEVVTRHFTLRRGFAVFMGLLILALYFLWAAYGAAPTSLSFISDVESEGDLHSMGGHGAATGTMTPERFEELTAQFVEKFSLPDGSVQPRREEAAAEAGHGAMEAGQDAAEAGHGAMPMQPDSGGHDMAAPGDAIAPSGQMAMDRHQEAETAMAATESPSASEDEEHGHGEGGEPIDVYIMAMQFAYEPQVLRLEHGVPYRFRLMSMDVNHGASVHTGFAGHIMRRPARQMVDMIMTFEEAGEYMVYCTVYCGEGHDTMKGKIIVE